MTRWVFWSSFVGAIETGNLLNEQHCINNAILLSLLASTTMAFYSSSKLNHGNCDPVHVANSILEGCVAIKSAAGLYIGLEAAIVCGAAAGAVSVYGYMYSMPYFLCKGIHNTCGIANRNGYPSLGGALRSVVSIALDSNVIFLLNNLVVQMLCQIKGMVATLFVSVISGYGKPV